MWKWDGLAASEMTIGMTTTGVVMTGRTVVMSIVIGREITRIRRPQVVVGAQTKAKVVVKRKVRRAPKETIAAEQDSLRRLLRYRFSPSLVFLEWL